MSWEQELTPDERRDWEAFVQRTRKGVAQQIAGSGVFVSLLPEGEPDIQFAVELGLAIMMNKPIVALRFGGRPVPERLRRVADDVIEIEGDPDTEAGRLEMEWKLLPALEAAQKRGSGT